MYRILIPLILVLFSCTRATTQTSEQDKTTAESNNTAIPTQEITTLRSNLFDNYPQEKHHIANFIEEYFNMMFDSTVQQRNSFWHSEILTDSQDYYLIVDLSKPYLKYYSPKILGIRDLKDNNYLATISFGEDAFPFKIMNLEIKKDALGKFYFIDQFGKNVQQFQISKHKNTTFYYSNKTSKNGDLEQKMIAFNQKMSNFFQIPEKNVKVVALKNLRDYYETAGFEYATPMTYDGQTGGIAIPKENLLVSANNSPYYPHELVHLYTADFNAHYWFDEGLATYLGGSVEYPLEHHLKKVAISMDTLNFSELPKDKKLDDDTSLKYSLGGLFCKLAYETYGMDGLKELLNSGKTEADFHMAITKVFKIEKSDYDTFIRSKLKAYL